jgi:hypothetical protein
MRLSNVGRKASRPYTFSVVVAGLAVAALSITSTTAGATDRTHNDHQTVDATFVVDWSATATAAIAIDAGLPAPEAIIGLSYVQAAVYDAVVGIKGRYTEYGWHGQGPEDASVRAAVAAAAHRVLLTYFPISQPRVDADYATSLAQLPDGWSKNAGVAFGERAAAGIIALRAGDGWNAPVTFTQPPAPGVWRPTPPANAPFLGPWIGFMKPFLLTSPSQFRRSGPPALTSARYAKDLNEVESLGSATSVTRTAQETDTAKFFGDNLAVQLQAGFRDYITRHHLDIVEAARYFAVADLSGADAVITAWDSKYHFGFWRPITAIQLADTDGNPATTKDPTWQPLLTTPPFPDYLSGHTTVTGAVTRALTGLLGTPRIDLYLSSVVTGTTRHYTFASQLNADSIGARIWAGIHFRTADEVGNAIGKQIGTWALAHYFRPVSDN